MTDEKYSTEHFPIIKHDSEIVTCLVCGKEYKNKSTWKEGHKPCKDCYVPQCHIHYEEGFDEYCENGSHFRN